LFDFRFPQHVITNVLSVSPGQLENFRCQRDDLHKLLPSQFPRDRTEDAGPDGLSLSVDEHAGIAVKLDIGTVLPSHTLRRSYDNRLADIAFFDRRLWDGFLHGDHHDIAERPIPPLRTA